MPKGVYERTPAHREAMLVSARKRMKIRPRKGGKTNGVIRDSDHSAMPNETWWEVFDLASNRLLGSATARDIDSARDWLLVLRGMLDLNET